MLKRISRQVRFSEYISYRKLIRYLETETTTRPLGLVVLRGPTITLLSPVDGSEEIANPFLAQDAWATLWFYNKTRNRHLLALTPTLYRSFSFPWSRCVPICKDNAIFSACIRKIDGELAGILPQVRSELVPCLVLHRFTEPRIWLLNVCLSFKRLRCWKSVAVFSM